jgi:protein-disulfide isomerase
MVSVNKPGRFDRLVPVLTLASLVLAFMVGVLWQKVQNLEKGGTVSGTAAQPAAQQQPTETQASLETIQGLFEKDVLKFGDKNAKLSFVEVADPSCPYCHIAAGHNSELARQVDQRFVPVADGGEYLPPVTEMKKLVDEGKANFVYIYTNGHGNGELSMKALYCADEKGKFWEVHDKLMTNEGYNLINNTIKNSVSNAGALSEFLKAEIDTSFLKSCLESGKYDKRLAADSQLASQIGISGTPGFYVNSSVFRGAYSFTDMKTAVDSAI